MRRLAVIVVTLLWLAPAAPAAAQEGVRVSVGELLENAAEVKGRVVVVGELIGDYGFRSDGSMWTQLNGDSYAYEPVLDGGDLTGGNVGVAVRIPDSLAATLDRPGGYRVRGPLVRVIGQWEYHDPGRGGESYIEVLSLEVLEPGSGLAEHPNYWVMALGLVLIVIAAVLRRGHVRFGR